MADTAKTKSTTQQKCRENCTCTAKSIICESKTVNQRFYKNAVVKQSVGKLVQINVPTEHMY